ncbi:MAG: ABC transporter ATP-binding protein [Methanomicrobiales archaeon]|nr:ABC transporter ATP-binding protein [Methanomicrobiales archaeon]
MIDLQGVSRKFGDHYAVRDVTLQIPRSSLFALIGPSGSGKTTLIRLITLLDQPTGGRILVDGADTRAPPDEQLALRRRMALVFQKPVPLSTTVEGNVAAGLRFRNVPKEKIRIRVQEALDMVGLTHLSDRNAATLSGGEMQRVALARALVTEPEVLLLDEPTANLDPVNATLIEDLILRINRERGTTVILSTHDLGQGQRLAGSIALLMQGRLHQSGNPREVFYHPSTPEAARFVGVENLLSGTIAARDGDLAIISAGNSRFAAVTGALPGEAVTVCLRAEDLILSRNGDLACSARNTLSGTITRIALHGSFARVSIDASFPVTALITHRSAEEMDFQVGQPVCITFKASAAHVIPAAADTQGVPGPG